MTNSTHKPKQSVMKQASTLALALVLAAIGSAAQAGVVLTHLGGTQYQVVLDPITFTVGTNQTAANRMVIEDFYAMNTTDGLSTHVSGFANWSRNGGPVLQITFETNNGAFSGTSGQVDPNDLLFNFTIDYGPSGAGAVNAGDTITLSTFNMIFDNDTPGLAPQAGPYTAHLLNGVTSIATAQVGLGAVPEPASLALLGLGLLGLGFGRYRKH